MFLTDFAFFVDFDGTMTAADTGVYLLDRLAPASWREIEEQYKAGNIGSRLCMERQWALLPSDRDTIEAVVREVPLDPGVNDFVEYLRSGGAEITMVSDGYGFRAREVAAQLGVVVLTNEIDWNRHEVAFGPIASSCPCGSCGTCKRAPIEEASRRGKRTVLVGDGASDIPAAQVADFIFAKGELAEWCAENLLNFTNWHRLSEVLSAIQRLLHEDPADGRSSWPSAP